MKVVLDDYMPKELSKLGEIANVSRNPENPTQSLERFKSTIDWGHDSIQEHAVYRFYIYDVSRVLLAQLTRHRIASFNVQSGRYVLNSKVLMPNIEKMDAKIFLKDTNEEIEFHINQTEFHLEKENLEKIKTEDLRYAFPNGVLVNLVLTINARSLRNLFLLRIDKHAQTEIRNLAFLLAEEVKKVHPEILYGIVFDSDLIAPKNITLNVLNQLNYVCDVCKNKDSDRCSNCKVNLKVQLREFPSGFDKN